MICPKCGGKLGVIDNAHDFEANEFFRQRKCKACGEITYTVESVIEYGYIRNEWNKYHRTTRENRRKLKNGS